MSLTHIIGMEAAWSPYFLAALFFIYLFTNFYLKNNINKTYLNLSLILIYLVKGSPINIYSHLLFSVHMLQMAILLFLIPPVLLCALLNTEVYKKFSKLNNPILFLILFNAFFSIYHFPSIFDVVKSNNYLHEFTSIFLFILAMLMWNPIISKFSKLSQMQKIAYIFANSVLITPACVLIIFSNNALYDTYTTMNGLTNSLQLCLPQDVISNLDGDYFDKILALSKVHDQQLGGVIMKILQEIIFSVAIGLIFIKWLKVEKTYNYNLEEK